MIDEEKEKIIDDPNWAIQPEQAREALSYLVARIADKRQEETDRERVYNQKWLDLRADPEMTNEQSSHKAKITDEYIAWKNCKNELAALQGKRSALEKKYSYLEFAVYKRGRIQN